MAELFLFKYLENMVLSPLFSVVSDEQSTVI